MLELVGLEPTRFADRFPHELSAASVSVSESPERWRPILRSFCLTSRSARSMRSPAPIFRKEFARLVRELGKTAVFVTHDLHEAMLLGSRIALMDNGQIVLLDTAEGFRNSSLPLARRYMETVAI
jgi:osmoprotectant transport system ATP-binding protein